MVKQRKEENFSEKRKQIFEIFKERNGKEK